MKKCLFTLFLPCVALCFLWQATGFAASHTPLEKNILEASRENAASMLRSGDYSGAYDLYMRLLREEPDNDDVTLGLARAATGYGRHNQAVMAYELLIEKYPNEPRLYVEVANAYMALQDRASAERAYAHARMLDPEMTQEGAAASIEKLGEQHSLLQLHGALRMGMLYDSNVNMGPDSKNITLGGLPLSLIDGKRTESAGSFFSGNVDIARRLERDSQWWLVGDVSTFVRGNFNNELRHNNARSSVWARGAAGARHTSSTTLLDMRVKAEIFDYEFMQNVSAYGPEAVFLWAAVPSLHLISRANIEHRDYSDESQFNGPAFSAGQYARLYFGESQHSLTLGGRYLGVRTKESDYRYDSFEGSARLDLKLPMSFELSPFITLAGEDYHGPATPIESDNRFDHVLRVGSSVVYNITENWDIDLMYQFTNRRSNSDLYDAEQHLVQMGVGWNF